MIKFPENYNKLKIQICPSHDYCSVSEFTFIEKYNMNEYTIYKYNNKGNYPIEIIVNSDKNIVAFSQSDNLDVLWIDEENGYCTKVEYHKFFKKSIDYDSYYVSVKEI